VSVCYTGAMTIAELRDACTALPGSTYDFPFDAETCVFRVSSRMFALAGINNRPVTVTLKCDPELARDLRAAYTGVEPGYHMNKEHWNTVNCEADVPKERILWLIEHSYELVVAGLPKARRPGG
jgi:predicted DNA-binding protein (MmcQ/YjbR family)